jgi:hypothetical protein
VAQPCMDDGCEGVELQCFGPRGEGGCGDSFALYLHDPRKFQPCMVCDDGILSAVPCDHTDAATAATWAGHDPEDWRQVIAFIPTRERWISYLPIRLPQVP